MVLVDYYSKWPKVRMVSNVITDVVIEFLGDVFSREGIPEILLSDNGPQLV